jgi:hypothetical protein
MGEHHHHDSDDGRATAQRSHALAVDPAWSVLRLSASHRLVVACAVLAVMWLAIWRTVA